MHYSQVTVEKIKDSYLMLSSDDIDASRDANHFLNTLYQREEIWNVCKDMISKEPLPNFQLLGAQILYQKLSGEFSSLPLEKKIEIRDFAFGLLQTEQITLQPTIDKLASICGILACSMYLQEWKTFMQDVFNFMKISDYCLLAGLFILERFPQQLRRTNRIAAGLKNIIIQQALKYQEDMIKSFQMILDLNNVKATNRCLKTMATWAQSKLNFLKYPQIMQATLLLSLQDFEKLDSALNMVLESIRGSSTNKMESLSGLDPAKQLSSYSANQLKSVNLIVSYIKQNTSNFLGSGLEPEQIEIFAAIIRQSLLDFGFLICEQIGFELLDIIVRLTQSPDLKTSRNNFQFWVDFSEKIVNSKLNSEVKNFFADYLLKAFRIINEKATVPDYLLDDPDLKEDLTVDDINNITVSEYRKDSVTFYQFFYDFFFKFTGKSNFFFEQCFKYIESDINENKLGGGTELALFCIKSAAESMVSEQDSANLRKIIGFIMDKGSLAPPRVVSEILLLIQSCTKQIKDEQGFSFKCLQYSMKYLSNDSLSFYASDSFKCLLETFTVINDASFVDSLLNFYSQIANLNDIIVEKIIDGILSIIFKISDPQFIKSYINKLYEMIISKFQESHQNPMQQEKPYFTPLLELKAILDNYDIAKKQVKAYLRQYFIDISKNSLQIINIVIPFCLQNQYKYILMNSLGLSCSIFRHIIRLNGEKIDPSFLGILENSFSILSPQKIVEMGAILNLLNESFITLMGHNLGYFNQWILNKLPYFNNFFCSYFENSPMPDPDAIRRCYEVLQNLILYNSQIFLALEKAEILFQYALRFLRHINEQKMQRKLINFIYLCMRQQGILNHKKQKVLEVIISSIPILHSQATANFSKILAIVLNAFPSEMHRPALKELLRKNPYQQISVKVIEIMIESILMALTLGKQRYVIMVIKDLTSLAINGENPQNDIQYQFRFSLWKKQLQQLQQQQQG